VSRGLRKLLVAASKIGSYEAACAGCGLAAAPILLNRLFCVVKSTVSSGPLGQTDNLS